MPSMEEIELEKRRKALDKDVLSLVDKYLRSVEWDIPKADEARGRQLVLDEIKQAIGRIENQSRGTVRTGKWPGHHRRW
jgi:hypothetical protein